MMMLIVISIKLLVIVAGMYYFFYLSLPYRLFVFQAVGAIIAEVTGWSVVRAYHQPNLWVFNIFHVAELWLLCMAAYYLLKEIVLKRIIILMLFVGTVIWVFGIFEVGILLFYTPYTLAHNGFLTLIFLPVLYYGIVSRKVRLRQHPQLWLSLSVIIFYGCELPFRGMFTYLSEHQPEILDQLFHPIVWTLNFIRYPMTAYALYLAGSQQKRIVAQQYK